MTAAAQARIKPLTRREATRIVNSMPYLVAASHAKLLPEMFDEKQRAHFRKYNQMTRCTPPPVIHMEFEVSNGQRSYVFKKQPFRVLRQITMEEYLLVFPYGMVRRDLFYYLVSTD